MSRIERYQESIEKFINKNITNIELKEIILKRDHLLGIVLASVLNNNTKKSNFKVHGYYMGIAIDLFYIINEYQCYTDFYKNKKTNNLIITCINTIYHLFQLNIESLKIPTKQEHSYAKIISFIFSYINSKINNITQQYKFIKFNKTTKTDILNLSLLMNDEKNELRNKLKTLQQVDKSEFEDYMNKVFGNIGMIVLIVGWSLGGGDLKPELMKELQTIGEQIGILYKICIDFDNIKEDILKSSKYSYNFIINYGVQDGFTYFMEIKTKILEACLKHNLYSHTVKEVIDLLETKIDNTLKDASIDMKSTYSSYSSK